jgi:release factor glutamine methyltransferase
MTATTLYLVKNRFRNALKDIYPQSETDSIFSLVFENVVGMNRTEQIQHPDKVLNQTQCSRIDEILMRLEKSEPIQYILGRAHFYGLELNVNPAVLIPRQETELLIETIIHHPLAKKAETLLDIGTGSGCIAIALKKYMGAAKMWALDISPEALETARKNAKNTHTEINFLCADILAADLTFNQTFDIVVSNPPYVRKQEIQSMHRNVFEYEPHEALFVEDKNPLVFYSAILEFCRKNLSGGGLLALEINEAFGQELLSLLTTYNYEDICLIKDLNNKDRIITAIKK